MICDKKIHTFLYVCILIILFFSCSPIPYLKDLEEKAVKTPISGTPDTTPDTTPDPTPEPTETPATGEILYQYWLELGDTDPVSDLTSCPDFPDNPSGFSYLTSFQAPSDWGEHYGSRIVGYLHPTVDGVYYFWIASDDHSELWLSTTSSEIDEVLIAHFEGDCDPGQYNVDPSQASQGISLNAGSVYYIEALHKESHGGDNLEVAWQPPGGSQEVIPGSYLSPYQPGSTPAPDPTPDPTPDPSEIPIGYFFLLLETVDAFSIIEGESYDSENSSPGLEIRSTCSPYVYLSHIDDGDWALFNELNFGGTTGIGGTTGTGFEISVASDEYDGSIELRLDSKDGTVIGSVPVPNTGNRCNFEVQSISISEITGIHDLYLLFSGNGSYIYKIDWFRFLE